MEQLTHIFGEGIGSAIEALERSPAEVKISLAIALGLNVDLSGYRSYVPEPMRSRPPSPLLTEATSRALGQALRTNDMDLVLQIYEASPPEQILLAIAASALRNNSK